MLIAGTDSDTYRTALPDATHVPVAATEWGLSGYEGYHGTTVSQVAASPSEPGLVWKIRTDMTGGFWVARSDDGGATWAYRGRDRGVPLDLAISPVDPERVVVAFGNVGGSGLFVTRDGGQAFEEADSGGLPMWVSDIVVSPTNHDTWYAATRLHAANGLVKGGRGVLRSTGGGRTWVNVSGGLQNLAVTSLVASRDGQWLSAGTVQGGVHRLGIG